MLKGWRTLILALGTTAIGVATQMDWTSVLSGPYAGWVVMGLGVASAVLRTVTNTPVGQK